MLLDAHERPPQYLRTVFKKYRHTRGRDLDDDPSVLDTRSLTSSSSSATADEKASLSREELERVFHAYLHDLDCCHGSRDLCSIHQNDRLIPESIHAYSVTSMPGLIVFPQLIPVDVQRKMLCKLLHRDLCNSNHLTNVHLHHTIEYPPRTQSFFNLSASEQTFIKPKDPSTHKAMTVEQFLNKKLRWTTLGGQYDWTNKVYPSEAPPPFPQDLRRLLRGLFPQTEPEAAIVNLYSPGDTLSLHRDVAEQSDEGLISVSIGCDGLFVIGFDPECSDQPGDCAVIRLRSGDAVYMSGRSRFAWHGVPEILSDTCPEELKDWPVDEGEVADSVQALRRYEQWRGWMSSKRINLNVRQMTASSA